MLWTLGYGMLLHSMDTNINMVLCFMVVLVFYVIKGLYIYKLQE